MFIDNVSDNLIDNSSNNPIVISIDEVIDRFIDTINRLLKTTTPL